MVGHWHDVRRITWKSQQLLKYFKQTNNLILLLFPCLLLLIFYWLFVYFDRLQYFTSRGFDPNLEITTGYLVWNTKCHVLSLDPLDQSIFKFVRKEKFESCSTPPLLSSILRKANGSVYLTINSEAVKHYTNFICCWSAISRPDLVNKIVVDEDIDSKYEVKKCKSFEDAVQLSQSTDIVLVTCKTSKPDKSLQGKIRKIVGLNRTKTVVVYKNVHAILHPKRVNNRFKLSEDIGHQVKVNINSDRTKLSLLILGIGSVSRLNFHRSMPMTRDFLEDQGWIELRGYNKVADNTFPNLMAVLTGQNESQVKFDSKTIYLDNSSFIWRSFHEIGYVTSFGEDDAIMNNFFKFGFVEPPTDYYLRPYMLASEKLLKGRKRFKAKYCTGPQLQVDRIFDYALEFAKTFDSVPYFGLFWVNSIGQNDVNGPSSIDEHFRNKLMKLEAEGVMNSSMLVLLSDHGVRFGDLRNTFVGWYEERLPFIYIWLPKWFRERDPNAYKALRLNRNRLTSPFDLYETLRDLVIRAGGIAPVSSGCSSCSSLFKPVPKQRGCADVGITTHWCTCFVDHVDEIVRRYENEKSSRLSFSLAPRKTNVFK